jgi:hypothetical protein
MNRKIILTLSPERKHLLSCALRKTYQTHVISKQAATTLGILSPKELDAFPLIITEIHVYCCRNCNGF